MRTESIPADARERVLHFLRRSTEALADEVRPIEGGWMILTPSLPEVWSLNYLRLSGPHSVHETLTLAEAHLAEAPYRQLMVEDEATGWELERSLPAAGWRMERELLMVLARPPDRQVDASDVIEADEQQMLDLMRLWYLEGPPETTPEGLRQLAEYSRREYRVFRDRTFGVLGEHGLAAMAKLRSDGRIAQVEDVYTSPGARRRGHARVLVTHAIAQARAGEPELTFIVADDNDWPKHLYRRLGFEPVGWTWAFHQG